MIEEFINSALVKYPANKDDIFISLVGFESILKIVFTTGLVLDFKPPNQLTIPHYSQVKEEIAEDFIDFDKLNKLFIELLNKNLSNNLERFTINFVTPEEIDI